MALTDRATTFSASGITSTFRLLRSGRFSILRRAFLSGKTRRASGPHRSGSHHLGLRVLDSRVSGSRHSGPHHSGSRPTVLCGTGSRHSGSRHSGSRRSGPRPAGWRGASSRHSGHISDISLLALASRWARSLPPSRATPQLRPSLLARWIEWFAFLAPCWRGSLSRRSADGNERQGRRNEKVRSWLKADIRGADDNVRFRVQSGRTARTC